MTMATGSLPGRFLTLITDDPPMTISSGQLSLRSPMDEFLAAASIADQHHRHHRQVIPDAIACSFSRLATWMPSRISMRTPAGFKPASLARSPWPRCARRGGALPFPGHQREQVAGPDEVVGRRGRIDDRPDRPGTLLGADAGPATDMIDRDRERRPVRGRVGFDHRAVEPAGQVGMIGMQSRPRPGDHERDRLEAAFGRDDEVPFVLAFLVIDHDQRPDPGRSPPVPRPRSWRIRRPSRSPPDLGKRFAIVLRRQRLPVF